MPLTRLVDRGMGHADARRPLAGTAAGTRWQDAAVAIADEQPQGARVWPDGEHGVCHQACERDAYAADWFMDQLLGRDLPNS